MAIVLGGERGNQFLVKDAPALVSFQSAGQIWAGAMEILALDSTIQLATVCSNEHDRGRRRLGHSTDYGAESTVCSGHASPLFSSNIR